ncbi:dipeptidase PepE [Pseudidiomarina sp.]|uniref:dipeptidase PepE n=1 Tax=Pseudidiomarina sp. TaxID=2081707 RepID=UPI003A96C461
MKSAQILLLSSSRAGQSDYLAPCLDPIATLCETRNVLFIPYAGVTMSYADYTAKVATALKPRNIQVTGIETAADPAKAIAEAEAIMVGGGNTFHLLQQLYHFNLIAPIQTAVSSGTPYIGWSAGSNIAGLSIRTTNDMPIIEPPSFTALKLVPFQLNPHYTDYQPPGFHGETRDQRLAEFMVLEPTTPVVAIPEGTALRISNQTMSYQGNTPGFVFLNGEKHELAPQQDCSQWLKAAN